MSSSIYTFERAFCRNEVKRFELEVLSLGLTDAFLPVSILHIGDELKMVYKYDGYRKISQLKFREVYQILTLLERILKKLEDASSYFIDFNRIDFSSETVFYNNETDDVRMAFIISEDGRSFGERFLLLVQELNLQYSMGQDVTLNEFYAYMDGSNRGIDEIRRKLKEMKREVYTVSLK